VKLGQPRAIRREYRPRRRSPETLCTLSENGERKGSREEKCMAPNERKMEIEKQREKDIG